jgi:hypothetical protein
MKVRTAPPLLRSETFTDGRLAILWTYHPHSLNLVNDLEFSPLEILLSDHKDIVARGCLIGLAVEDNRALALRIGVGTKVTEQLNGKLFLIGEERGWQRQHLR